MLKEIAKHKLAYIILFVGFTTFVFMFLGFWPDRYLQRLSIMGVMVFYFVWGVAAHVKTDTLTKHVMLEYATVVLLGGSLLMMLTV